MSLFLFNQLCHDVPAERETELLASGACERVIWCRREKKVGFLKISSITSTFHTCRANRRWFGAEVTPLDRAPFSP